MQFGTARRLSEKAGGLRLLQEAAATSEFDLAVSLAAANDGPAMLHCRRCIGGNHVCCCSCFCWCNCPAINKIEGNQLNVFCDEACLYYTCNKRGKHKRIEKLQFLTKE